MPKQFKNPDTMAVAPTVANQMRTAVLLFVGALFFFLAGNSQSALWDRDEPRYAVATREMIQTNDWIIPHFNGQIRYDKPALIYWLMALPTMLFGEGEFASRFIASLCGALRVSIIFLFALRMGAGRAGALLAAAVAGTSLLLVVISKAATIDSALVLTIVVALWLLWERIAFGFAWWKHLLFWIMIALSVMLKGPPGPAVVGLCWTTFRIWSFLRRGSDSDIANPDRLGISFARSLVGLAIFFVWVSPWVWITHQADSNFLAYQLNRHVAHRIETPMEGHAGPFYYYIVTLIPSILPCLAPILCGLIWSFRRRETIAVRFLWCWFLPAFVLFSFVQTKLPHYVAPLIPALGIVAGLWWKDRGTWKMTPCRVGGALLIAAAGIAFPVALHFYYNHAQFLVGRPLLIITGAIIAMSAVGGAAFWLMRRDAPAMTVWVGGWLLAVLFGLCLAFPPLDALRPSRQLGAWIRKNAPADVTVMMVEYEEPSLIYYAGRQIVDIGRNDRQQAFAALNDRTTPAVLVTTADRWQKFKDEYLALERGKISDNIRVGRQLHAFYFEKGEWMDLRIICNWPKPESLQQEAKQTP